MNEKDGWTISMMLACIIIMVYAAVMLVNPGLGVGFVIYGGIAFVLSLVGYLRALQDDVQDLLDNIQEQMLAGGIK